MVRACDVARASLLILITLTIPSCGPTEYAEPLAEISEAVDGISAGAQILLSRTDPVHERNCLVDAAAHGWGINHDRDYPGEFCVRSPDSGCPCLTTDSPHSPIVTQAEITVRVQALDALSRYTLALADLGRGKGTANLAQQTQGLSKALGDLGKSSKELPAPATTILKNDALSAALGQLANAIEARVTRRALESSVAFTGQATEKLLAVLGDDLNAVYAKQQTDLRAEQGALVGEYNQASRARRAARPLAAFGMAAGAARPSLELIALERSNPAPAGSSLQAAYGDLVDYGTSHRDPAKLKALVAAAQKAEAQASQFSKAAQDYAAQR